MLGKWMLSAVLSAYVATVAMAGEGKAISLKTRDALEVGLQTYNYKYEETVNGASFMKETGNKYGFSATAIESIDDEYYLIVDGRYATGDVEYNSGSGTGEVSDKVYEVRLLAGKEAEVNDYLLSSYAGIGYRVLKNDLRDLGTGGYRRKSEYLYIPIGVTHRFLVDSDSRVSTSIEYDYLVRAQQTSYTSDFGAWNDMINKQKHGYGVRINTAYEQDNWSIGLFFNYWKIADSDISYYILPPFIYSGVEPKNETKEYGIQLKYRF